MSIIDEIIMPLLMLFLVFILIPGSIVLIIVLSISKKKAKKKRRESLELAFISNGYKVTQKIADLIIDQNNKVWTVTTGNNNNIYKFSDILGFKSFQETGRYITKGRVTEPFVKGIYHARTSQVCRVHSYGVMINVKNLSNPIVKINLLESPSNSDSFSYSNACSLANQIIATLNIMQRYSFKIN